MASNQRILSIQSHVVSGYVGNKSAVFPLQLLGFDVDIVNSVHFSNHTGYENGFTGDVMSGGQLRNILDGLEKNGLLSTVGHLLTGYIGSESFLSAVIDVIRTTRKYSNQLRYICDPVLGDDDKFYVPESLVQVYIDTVIPEADVITPNQFEVEKLTGIQVDSIATARQACQRLHDIGPGLVCITSVLLPEKETSSQKMCMIASQRCKDDGKEDSVWKIDFPMLPGQYTGTGDLCAALLLAHTASSPLPEAMEKVVNTMHAVLCRTNESAGDSILSRELKLVQSKRDIENPPDNFKAVQL
mmetsp:Transcript_13963/g.28180  ORF Transcript_13963/g.28180 Transcript_13963/m.28180 type:complete len:300 (-) Transcript_13963:28-927(-)